MDDERSVKVREAVAYLKERLHGLVPEVGIVLGSGLGKFGESIDAIEVIPYADIPNFVKSTAIGHKGNFIFGRIGGRLVCAMQGRFHYYEGYNMDKVTLPVRVMKLLGIKYLFVSNAAGGLNPDFSIGDLMVIEDHINMMPNPLIGGNMDEFGIRFPDMSWAYDRDLIAKAEAAAKELGITLRKGVYLANTGPTYETPAEIRFYYKVGADAVGMSTVPEVIVARHSQIPVFGISIITNVANKVVSTKTLNDGDDVVRIANEASDRMAQLFTRIIETL